MAAARKTELEKSEKHDKSMLFFYILLNCSRHDMNQSFSGHDHTI